MAASKLFLCALFASATAFMDCGAGVQLCAVVTLESGNGDDYYRHDIPSVHGLWPSVAPEGTSDCVRPADRTPRTVIPRCYNTDPTQDFDHQLWFVNHEWEKHGECAGVRDADDYFEQVCGLVADPIAIMTQVKQAGGDLQNMSRALVDAGYPVYETDATTGRNEQQLQLSACAKDGRWILADVADFPRACGGSWIPPPPGPAPVNSCEKGVHGPVCTSDDECSGLRGCVRCARTGFCTDVPLFVTKKLREE